MDKRGNPFRPGAGARPPVLAGREPELEDFDVAVHRYMRGHPERSILLSGLRGVGKTVLLRECERIAGAHGWEFQSFEAGRDDESLAGFVATGARAALLRYSRSERLKEGARNALAVLRSFQVRWKLSEGNEVVLAADPAFGRADSGSMGRDMIDLLLALGEAAAERRTGVLFTIDEMQFLPGRELADLCMALHRVSQNAVPVMVAGAGLPSLPGLVGEAKSYGERLFSFRTVNSLSHDDARRALVDPVAPGLSWEPDALDEAVETSGGYPYFLQELGRCAWNATEGPDAITLADVRRATPEALRSLDDGFFRVRFDRATDGGRSYLRAMAALGAGPHRSQDVADQLGKSVAAASPLRGNLIKKGLCYVPRPGYVGFTVPLFDDYLRRTAGA